MSWDGRERVEGYTNGLFTLLEGLLGAAGQERLDVWCMIDGPGIPG